MQQGILGIFPDKKAFVLKHYLLFVSSLCNYLENFFNEIKLN